MVSKLTMQQAKALMRAHGFSASACDQIVYAIIDDAVRNASDIHADRIYTIIALMLHRAYGFGHKRIFKGLEIFDALAGEANSGAEWPGLMDQLKKETGIVVRSGDDDRIAFEYDAGNMED